MTASRPASSRKVLVVSVPKELTPNGEMVDGYQLRLIASALAVRGWSTESAHYDPRMVDELRRRPLPDAVFNLAYGYVAPDGGSAIGQPEVARDLERLGVPMVGSESSAQARAQDKVQTDTVVANAGVRVAERFDFDSWPESVPVAVRKPRFGAFHRGVSLVRRCERGSVAPLRPDEILQPYLDGPEFTVSVLAEPGCGRPVALHPLRLQLPAGDAGPRIISHDTEDWRWVLTEERLPWLESAAVTCFEALGLRDYARFDFRVVDGEAVLMDANALPGLHPVTGLFPLSALGSGLQYHHLIWRLIDLQGAAATMAMT